MPKFEANAPARKGIMAEPISPDAPTIPTVPDMSHAGTICFVTVIIRGYIGPRRKPMRETATASPISDLTDQTIISNLHEVRSLICTRIWGTAHIMHRPR